MNRLENVLKKCKKLNKKALSVFLTAGYPALSETENLILRLADAGVDFFELGLPFSDPIADGPTIQKSSEIALKNGMDWKKGMALAQTIRKKSNVPLVLMSYANPLYCRTWAKAAKDLASAGFDGVIIPDLTPEENKEAKLALKNYGISLIHLLAPTSSLKRIKIVAKESSGFIYCVSVAGVTGKRSDLPYNEIEQFLRDVKKVTNLPLLLGFGISRAEQLDRFKNGADGFIIGSALVEILSRKTSPSRRAEEVVHFIKSFVEKL